MYFQGMKVLLLGGGGREHALAWKLTQSPHCEKLFVAPGNPGTATLATNLTLDSTNPDAVAQFALNERIGLVVIGPEAPLVAGVADACRLAGIPVMGPDKGAARLEGSKRFAKDFMLRHGIPTARYGAFTEEQQQAARSYLKELRPPYVVKADGLAAGKGVYICQTLEEAEAALADMFEHNIFGAAGATVVIEEFLDGIEVSMFALCDGKDYVMLPAVKDYKRVGEGDRGPNTGGMGSVSPVFYADDVFFQRVEERVVRPTLRGMAVEGQQFVGVLFIGIMVVHGEPYVLEYNVRFGDPETQSIMARIDSDLVDLFHAAATGRLSGKQVQISPKAAVTVVCVSEGYPGHFEKGKAITGLEQVQHSVVFHAGTAETEGQLVTNGGRVLAVTATADSLPQARELALADAARIQYDGVRFRADIAADVLMEP